MPQACDLTAYAEGEVGSAKERIHRAVALSLGFGMIAAASRNSHRGATPMVGGPYNLEGD
jgi:hypothetical protein